MSSIEASLDRLAALAGRLNQETDTLNWVIEAVENRLQSMNIGVTYWDSCVLGHEEELGNSARFSASRGWLVGYTKIKDAWRLAVKGVRIETGYFEGDASCPYRDVHDVDEPMPLLNASRTLRVEAVGRIEELLDGLANVVDSYVDEITEAKSLVTD